MSKREQQKRLISRLRGSMVATSVISALGIAGYLGASIPTATASDTDNSNSSDTGTSTATETDSDSSTYFGDSTGISSGSGTSHAATSGS